MTKADLARLVYEELGVSKKESISIVELVFDSFKVALSEGETIKIHGFGTFLVRKKGARKGRNLRTMEEISVAARRVLTFKASNLFKAMVEKV